jgi:hypothetical protein
MNYHGRTGAAELTRYLLDPAGRPTGEKQTVYRWADDSAAQPIGLAFEPSTDARRPVVWIALGLSLQGHSGWSDPWAGRVYRMELPGHGSDGDVKLEAKIVNLPHAFHTVNNLRFGPDRMLYLCCGSTTTSGWEPHTTEQLLSGAILQIDVSSIDGTLDVKTSDGGNYNPFAPAAPVRLFASGIRQAYDGAWHPNGRLYACTNQNDVNGQTGAAGGVPSVQNVKPPEFLAIIERGKTYGFPNAARGEFVLMGGNPTEHDDGWTEVNEYPAGVQPPPTFDPSLLHRIDDIQGGSANGILCYQASGALRDRLICCFYNANMIYTFTVGSDGHVTGRDPLRNEQGEPLPIAYPLDLCEHPTSGHLYVAAYGKQDKGEGGGVYFLERTSPTESQMLVAHPRALIASSDGDPTGWHDNVVVSSSDPNAVELDADANVDWLTVEARKAAMPASSTFEVRAARPLSAGTHYGSVLIRDNVGNQISIGVQLYVPDAEHRNRFAVSAGNSREMTVAEFPVHVALEGTVMSVGSVEELETEWELASGPIHGISLADPKRRRTDATITQHGAYQLRFVARRAGRERYQPVTYLVDEPGNETPRVQVTAAQHEVVLGQSVTLSALASDDGRPASIGAMTYRWTREGTGNGIVMFSNTSAASTDAQFSRPGDYRLRCTVSDGVRESWADVEIHVAP